MTRAEKVDVAESFSKAWGASQGAVLVDFRGVTVAEMTSLRKRLRAGGISLRVVKNTLAMRAIGKERAAQLAKHLQGPTAIALSAGDSLAAAKTLFDVKRTVEKLQLKAVLLEGVVYEAGQIEELANLPSRQELLASLVGSLAAPLQGLVATLSGVLRQFISTTDALREKREKETPTQPA